MLKIDRYDRRYTINSSLIKNELNWSPSYSLKAGLKITVQWYLDNLKWCYEMNKKSNYQQKRVGFKTLNHQEL